MDRLKQEKLQFVTHNKKTQHMLQSIPRIASTNISVLITGESGTGKEIVANLIHTMSERSKKHFVAVNCAALPADLLESELFGHKKGAFTGAVQDHRGLFETAEGGTIFLDEIGDMALHLQSKLLRILQEKRIRPIGGSGEKLIDFRIVSATHRPLKDEIRYGNFREDLFYRLNGISLHLPPLRERPEDIPDLVSIFSCRYAQMYSITPIQFSIKAMNRLMTYPWPGNVRQLENLVEQMTVLYQGKKVIEADELPLLEDPVDEIEKYFYQQTKLPTLAELNEKYIRYIYNRSNHHQGEAAKILGLSRRTLYRKIRDFSYDSSEVNKNLDPIL